MSKLCIIYTLLLVMCILPILVYGTIYDLVSQYSYYYYSSTYNNSYNWSYHYSPQDPIYIDHIANGNPLTHEVQTIDGNEVLSYYSYNNEGVLLSHYTFKTDQNNDMLEMNNNDSEQFYFHYLQPGLPDSIEITRNYEPFHSYHKLEYDSENRLVTATQYVEENSVWTPYLKHEYYYNSSSVHYPSPLDFNLARKRSLLEGTEYFGCWLDKYVVPDSISGFEWVSQNGWQLLYNPLVGVSFSNGTTYIYCAPYIDTYRFNSSGLYIGRDDPGYMQYSYGYGLSWYTVNPVDDNYVEPAIIYLSACPNPFIDNLNISIIDNKAPTDISIYNLKGQLIRSWKDVRADELTWDGKDNANHPVSSGIYIIKARQGKDSSVVKVIKY
jgi:hypothetical protein